MITVPFHILLIEESVEVAARIQEMLAESRIQKYEITQTQNLTSGLGYLTSHSFDLILLDLFLPDSKGLETVSTVRSIDTRRPIVALSTVEHEVLAINAMEMDVQDYLIKNEFNSSQLKRAMLHAFYWKRIADDLRARKEKLRYAIAASGVATWHLEFTTNMITWNANSLQIFSYPPDDALSYEMFLQMIKAEDRHLLETAIREALQEKTEFSVELGMYQKSNTTFWIMMKGRCYYDANGETAGMDGVAIDITDRKLTEEALFKAKHEWEITFDTVPDMISIIDNQHRIKRINKAMAKRMGIDPRLCIGLHCFEAMHGLCCPPACCPGIRTFADNQEHIEEVQFEKIGGSFLVSTTPMLDTNGEKIGAVHVARDITAQKQAELEIAQLNRELSAQAAELAAVNRELSSFNYAVAHDLRKPLTIISGYSEAAQEKISENIDSELKNYLGEIQAGIHKMNSLIDVLINFAHLSQNEINKQLVNLSSLAREVAAELQQLDPARVVYFRIMDQMSGCGDPELLRVVLDNLLGNAWKYTAKRQEGLIEFGMTECKGQMSYFVSDNGEGFDMTAADNIFTPFLRLPGSESFKGFGIGLATVERIVTRHGGKLWAEGAKDKGATIYFTLPDCIHRNQ